MMGMTAYAYKDFYYEDIYVSIEIKTVNNRYLDLNVSSPSYLNSFEPAIRKLIQQKIIRGKIDFNLYIKHLNNNKDIDVNLNLAKDYYDKLMQIITYLKLDETVKLFHLTRYDGIVQANEKRDYTQYWEIVEKNINEILDEINKFRKIEGETTKKSILKVFNHIKENVNIIQKSVPKMEQEAYSNMKERLLELIGDNVEEQRLISETGIMIIKSCINEEVERLQAHIAHFEKTANEEGDIGKKLDFICQEMYREINTVGSKISLVELSENVVLIKHDIEKLREMLRNIE